MVNWLSQPLGLELRPNPADVAEYTVEPLSPDTWDALSTLIHPELVRVR